MVRMSVPGQQEMSLRPRRFEYKRLGWALLISLLIHAFLYGGYQFSRNVLPVWMAHVKFLAALAHELQARQQKPPPPPQPTAVPLVFVEVNPQAATAEPPKDAKYYSSQNSKASDSSNKADTDTPEIKGNQDKVVKTDDAPRKFAPLQPSPAPKEEKTELAKEDKPAEKARPKPPIGDLAMAKPTTELQRPDTGQDEHTRPRTIAEARMRQQRNNNMMPGEKMKQEGGVRHHLEISSFDAKATSFGEYDRAFIEAVEQHWFDLLDDKNYAYDRTGKVVLQFKLTYDGRITDMTMQSTVGQTLGYVCELAVLDNVPYERWPSDMRHELGNSRTIQFTFYY